MYYSQKLLAIWFIRDFLTRQAKKTDCAWEKLRSTT